MFTTWSRWWHRWQNSRGNKWRHRHRRRPARSYRCRFEQLETRLTPAGTFTGGVSIAAGNVLGAGFNDIVTAAGQGGGPNVKVFSGQTGALANSFMAYDPSFTGGVRVAVGDVEGTGVPDIITAAGPGGGPHVKVFNGRTGALVSSFMAYDPSFTGGVTVAVGDVDGTGHADIITGPGPGGPPTVKIFTLTGQLVRSFNAYDATFTGGVSVAAADIEGVGHADIVTGAGPGGGPHVKVFSGPSNTVLRSFMAYDTGFTGGVNVAAAGSGTSASIVTGARAGGGPHVKAFNASGTVTRSFMAYDTGFTGGVTVAAQDFTADGTVDIVTGSGPGVASSIRLFNGATQAQMTSFTPFDPVQAPTTGFSSPVSNNPTTGGGPALISPIGDVQASLGTPSTVLDLASHFSNPSVTDTVLRFNTVDGTMDVELFNQRTPITVNNFLFYVNNGRYTNSIIHRAVHRSDSDNPGLDIVQGGGFTFQSSPPSLPSIPTNPPIQNEPGIPNTRGTIAMAKTSDPNSATSQFFFNTQNNSALDSPANSGGFTVFGQIRNGLSVLDALAAVPTQNHGGVFTNIPLINYTGTNFPTDTTAANYELINSVTTEPSSALLTYTVVSNSNGALVTPTFNGSTLTLQYAAGHTGTASITIRAADANGHSVTATFNVTVAGAPGG